MRTVEPKIKVSATSPFQAECGNLSSASEKLSKRKLLQSFRTVSPSKKDTKRKGEASKHGYRRTTVPTVPTVPINLTFTPLKFTFTPLNLYFTRLNLNFTRLNLNFIHVISPLPDKAHGLNSRSACGSPPYVCKESPVRSP